MDERNFWPWFEGFRRIVVIRGFPISDDLFEQFFVKSEKNGKLWGLALKFKSRV